MSDRMKTGRAILFLNLAMLLSCSSPTPPKSADEEIQWPAFETSLISNQAALWWARSLADVDADGILDIVLQNDNGYGGWLGYLKGNATGEIWQAVIVAEQTPSGNKFAAGDLEAADLDGDGDIDLIAVEHPGEWSQSGAPSNLYWYEQSDEHWIPHNIGSIPSFLKDMSLADLDNDGTLEVITLTYDAQALTVFGMKESGYQKLWELLIENLHEGMDVGDLNGDGQVDIAANGYWLQNPGHLDNPWNYRSIDEIWHNQEDNHWARNATKVACADVDEDIRAEVFVCHSEKADYPLVRYDFENGKWEKESLIDSLPAAHSLVVADIDLDGQEEVLTGVNRHRARDIFQERGIDPPREYPLYILKQTASGWIKKSIDNNGVYNLLAGDLEGDGDIDLIRWTSHDMKDMWLMKNLSK